MAKIVTNELAPKDAKTFSLANESFEVPFETTDPTVLANARTHPWLTVEYGEQAEVGGQFADNQVKPEDDPMSALNDRSNDPDFVREQQAESTEDSTPLAVDAGLDQDKAETVGEGDNQTAVTLAADDTNDTPARKTRRAAKED